MGNWRTVLGVFLTVAALTGATACGSSSDSDTEADSAAGSAQNFPEYDGPEAGLPASYEKPVKKEGVDFSVGWLNPHDAQRALHLAQESAANATRALGGTFIPKDAEVTLNKQVSQCNDVLAQRVEILAPYPVVPEALAPCIAKAPRSGVKVTITQDTPPQAGKPPLPGYESVVRQSRDIASYETAKAAAQAAPEGATFAQISLGVPVPLLDYGDERTRYWAKRFGLKFAGRVTSSGPYPNALSAAANSLLAKYPDVDVVFNYDDLSAQTLVTTARANGRELIVLGNNGDAGAVEMVKNGQMVGTYAYDFPEIGCQMIYGAYNVLTEQNLPLPKEIAVPGVMVTEANADSFEPFEPKEC